MTDAVAAAVTFDLPGPEYERFTWLHDEHGPASSSPLAITIRSAWDSDDARDGLPESIRVNGYGYTRADHRPAESTLPGHLQGQRLPEDDSNLLDWRERCLPLVNEVCAEIEAFDPHAVKPGQWREVIESHQRRIGESMRLVHETAVFDAQMFAETFAARYAALFGDARASEGLALLQGFPNASTERAVALWDLGRIARRSRPVMAAVQRGELPGGDSEDEKAFRRGFAMAMERFGHMTPMPAEDVPTWREDVAVPLGIIRMYAAEGDGHDPRLMERAGAAKRETLEAALEDEAKRSPEAADLLRMLPFAQHIGPVTEDHNMLADSKVMEASRGRWLKVGEMLRGRGVIERPDDVYYFEFGELMALLEGGVPIPRRVIAERRARQARWRSVSPPAVLGKGARSGRASGDTVVVTGTPAAAGVYTGRARVINSIAEAASLEEGDVLICDVTSPPWTPYFAVIGAVVTNIGSVLAHGAIVAREFGIPAVVATRNGTEVIPDGVTVTVDGAAGTVTVVAGPSGR